jgi:hypothetical protein
MSLFLERSRVPLQGQIPAKTSSGREEQEHMVKVSVEVRNGAAHFRVGVQAKSIRRALGVVGARHPQGEVRVIFPIEPDGFFVNGSAGVAMVEIEHPRQMAA